ncbi:MAG TPA: phospholipase D-like domain-containing protein [Gemmatimonadales bacterium]|nr:phospholipase D-like domain-containing protein [Gemmatimonadales bacterium]
MPFARTNVTSVSADERLTAPLARRGRESGPLERAADRAAGTPAVPGNRVTLRVDGPATYDGMLAMIATARRRVHLENYIIRDDATGRRFADAMLARAAAGVRVRVLFDWIGSIGTSASYWDRLRRGGVEVRVFGRPRLDDPLLIAVRDHRKVLVVDGERGSAGGLCLGDEWLGDPARGRQPWRDTALEVEGPAARALDAAFLRAWAAAGGPPPDDGEVPGEVEAAGDVAVRVIATEPGRERAGRVLDLLLGVAADRIWVTEAYFAVAPRLYQALADAARAGVDVRLLVPGASDIPSIRNLSRAGYRGLLRAGVRIWEWQGPMLHAKTIVADGRWLRVGSSNLNPSSLLANWELDLFVDHEALAQEAEHRFVLDLSHASEVVLQPRRLPGVLERIDRKAPVEPLAERHAPGFRERRRRAFVLASTVVRGARAAVFGPLAMLLFVVSAVFFLLPVPAALAAAIGSLLVALALAVRALGHRARG